MELDNFFLAEYNKQNIDHQNIVNNLGNDYDAKTYLGNLNYHIDRINQRKEDNPCNHAYIAYYDDIPVGFISIYLEDEMYQISYGIVKEKRGEYLAALLLQEFSEEMFEEYPEIDTLTLLINNLNTGSKKTANLAGYTHINGMKHTMKRM